MQEQFIMLDISWENNSSLGIKFFSGFFFRHSLTLLPLFYVSFFLCPMIVICKSLYEQIVIQMR